MNSGAGVSSVASAQPTVTKTAGEKPPTVTDERVILDAQGHLFGLGFGFTLSETNRVVSGDPSKELVRTTGRGGTALELNVKRVPLGDGKHLEVQGPGAGVAGRRFQLRLFGMALTGEAKAPDTSKAISYTFEIKADQKTLARSLAFAGAKTVRGFFRALVRKPLLRHIGKALGVFFQAAVPVLGGVVAFGSITNAIRICRKPEASWLKKLTSIAHAVCDLVFIVNPVAGTVGGLAVSAVSIGHYLATRRDRLAAASTSAQAV